MDLVLTLLTWLIFITLLCVVTGMTLYLTTVYTLRAWHCYKNIKVDPVNAIKKADTSVARAEELKSSYQKIIDMG